MIGSKISKRYAKALLSLGQEDGQYQIYGENLQEFSSFCSANNEFFQVISNQIFSVEERKKIIDFGLGKSGFPDIVKNFLRLLLDKNRIRSIHEITDYYSRLTDELLSVTHAEIVTARPLETKAVERLKEALKGFVSKEIKTEVKEDESLIGGLVVKIGDLVLDGSVRAQIEGLKESLKRGEYS